MNSAESIPIDTTSQARWNIAALVGCYAVAALLLGSWFFAPTREWWDRLDVTVFEFLNGCLDGPEWWKVFWAIANFRAFDLVPAIITFVIFIFFLRANDRRTLVRRAAAGLVVALFILLVRKISGLELFEMDRKSPSKVIEGAIRLSKEVPWIGCKDSSRHSFPGDHSLFLIMLTVFFWYYGGLAYGLLYTGVTVVFSLPRMVAGAHWLTDNLVGGGFIALVSMSILLATPLHHFLIERFEPLARKVLGRFQKAPH